MRATAFLVAISIFVAYLPIPAAAESGWVTIVSPSQGTVIIGEQAEISVSFNTGSSEKITRVEVDVDGANYGVKHLSEPTERGISSFLMDTTRFGNGNHKIVAKVFSGNKLIGSTSSDCGIGNQPVDVIGPDIKFVGIKKHDVVKGIAIIEVAAQDCGRENPLVSVFVDKSLKLIKNTPPYVYTWDTTEYDNGLHVLETCGYDGAGNKSRIESVEVMVNNPGQGVIASKPIVEKNNDATVPDAAVIATMPQDIVEPIIPIERHNSEAAARSTDVLSVTPNNTNTPIAKSDHLAVTTEMDTRTTAPRSIDSQVSISEQTKSVMPALESATPVVEEPITPASSSVVEPYETLPSSIGASNIAPDILSGVAASVVTPTVATVPSAAPPSATPAGSLIDLDQTKLQTIDSHALSAQKLTHPQIPEPEPVKMAMAIQPSPLANTQSLEAQKVKIRLQLTKKNGTLVAELRSIIESAGGKIISWDNSTKSVLAALDGKTVRIKINDHTAIIGDQTVQLTNTPFINSSGRTMVDVKFLKSLLGTRLDINEDNEKYTLVCG